MYKIDIFILINCGSTWNHFREIKCVSKYLIFNCYFKNCFTNLPFAISAAIWYHMAADMANGKSVKLMITSFNKVFGTPLPDIWQYGSFFFR